MPYKNKDCPAMERLIRLGWRVLIVDDNKDLRQELSRHLIDQGFTVFKAPSGKHALSFIHQKEIDVCIVDLDLRGIDGIDTAEQIQYIAPDIRIIILSARDSPAYRRRAIEKKLRIERWIDKDSNYMEACTFAVLDAIAARIETSLAKSLDTLQYSAKLTPDQVLVVRQWLIKQHINLPAGMYFADQAEARPTSPTPVPRDLEAVLRDMDRSIEACYLGYADPAQRQIAWDEVRRLGGDQLWPAIETATANTWKRQLTIVLKMAILRIEAPLLLIHHLEAAGNSIQRLRSQVFTEEDLSQCERLWEEAGLDAVPSLAHVLENWHLFYSETSDNEREGITRDDDTDSSLSG